MKRKLLGLLIAVLLLAIVFSGCTETTTKTEIDRFVGTWRTSSGFSPFNNISLFIGSATFYKNGTGKSYFSDSLPEQFNYSISDGKITIALLNFEELSIEYNYSFSENDTRLNLTNNENTFILEKEVDE